MTYIRQNYEYKRIIISCGVTHSLTQ